ncbi:type II toxin-antitoxin system PemK/MazF family toxin [Xylocopilactobacillus apicola]|uniref:type II toxin-antitoxin system PemK/MazF family toxin n=1 Tax=Xylocopilactobacillus apicola TaxID=2932184 RepID=UPI0029539A7C|nr:type II toxin-antitoxin system PemK/MazF family toxin [Xylocopilactobacillus apicola]
MAYLKYDDITGGKTRPVLYIEQADGYHYVYKITSKFSNKSLQIRPKHYEINDWKQSGLKKGSWIDCNKRYKLPIRKSELRYLGKLSKLDLKQLLTFMNS